MSAQNGPLEAGAGKESSVEDRRGATRYPLSLQTTGHVLGPRGNVPWVARITDISATGIGLVFSSRIKPGTVLVITLQGANQKLSRPIPVRVMHSTPLDEKTWRLGCAFVRKVNEEDLQALLSRASKQT
jgi:hypothetical protein